MQILLIFINTIWFFLPAAIANSTPVPASKIKLLKPLGVPIDRGATFRNKPILGKNKTVRGVVAGTFMAIFVTCILWLFLKYVPFLQNIIMPNYLQTNPIILGFLLGFGALFGDMTKSFVKRQFNVKPGGPWFPFDQIDYIIGCSIFTYFYFPLPVYYYILALFIGSFGTIFANKLAFKLGIKNVPY